jgi:hypothetical protein
MQPGYSLAQGLALLHSDTEKEIPTNDKRYRKAHLAMVE